MATGILLHGLDGLSWAGVCLIWGDVSLCFPVFLLFFWTLLHVQSLSLNLFSLFVSSRHTVDFIFLSLSITLSFKIPSHFVISA